jgi:hypothetical protein
MLDAQDRGSADRTRATLDRLGVARLLPGSCARLALPDGSESGGNSGERIHCPFPSGPHLRSSAP